MSSLQLLYGTLFAGRYRINRCIAIGGMGAVYEVMHVETQRRRALKVMLPHLVQSGELRDRFRQEARIAAHIESDFIVDVFDAGIDDMTGMPFLVMELLRGEELGKRLARLGILEPVEVIRCLWQTALALDKTHRANIVHRDLKPENLFLAEREYAPPQIKVLDFGIAKFVAEGGTQGNATKSLGTPLYMAPEQFKHGSKICPATDIYSLAMVAYTLLVGAPYWKDEQSSGGNIYSFVAAVMNGPQEAASARAFRQGMALPTTFDTWFFRATAQRPGERFATAKETIQTLANIFGIRTPGFEDLLSASSLPSASTLDSSVSTVQEARRVARASVVTSANSSRETDTPTALETWGARATRTGRAILKRPISGRASNRLWVRGSFVGVLGAAIVVGLVIRSRSNVVQEQAASIVAPSPNAVVPPFQTPPLMESERMQEPIAEPHLANSAAAADRLADEVADAGAAFESKAAGVPRKQIAPAATRKLPNGVSTVRPEDLWRP